MASLAGLFGFGLAAMLMIMAAAWIFQRSVGNSGWIDVFWTFGTGAVGAAAALTPDTTARGLIAAAVIVVWSLRLGLHVGFRVASSSEDARYDYFRKEWGANYQRTLFLFVMPQALITALMILSIRAATMAPGAIGLRDLLAVLVLAIAIGGEALADRQLAVFKKTAPKGGVADRGLWSWSRHPNYFFEWLGWLAWPVMGLDPARPITFLTLMAPAIMFVVLRYITGVPPLERTMLKSRGDKYRAYQARTSTFLLLPPKKPGA